MEQKREGIFRNTIRAFFRGFAATIGVWLAFVPLVILIALLASGDHAEISVPGKYLILPNSEGKRTPMKGQGPIILQVNIGGVIGPKKQMGVSPEGVAAQLQHSREGELKGDRVKAVLLNINSPGGSAIDSDTIYRTIVQYKERYNVPVYAYVEGLCASGGYYIAVASDRILSSPVGLIGSVGVIANYFNVYDTLQKIGVQPETLYKGKGKDDMNPFRPWEKGDDEQTQRLITFFYERFVEVVADNRPNLSRAALMEEFGASLFPAPIALESGYIDEVVFSKSEALERLAAKADLGTDYQVVEFVPNRSIFELFSAKSPLITGKMEHTIDLPGDLRSEAPNGYLYLYQPGR